MQGETGDDEGMPRWVKVSGILALVAVVVFLAIHLSGNSPGGHGP